MNKKAAIVLSAVVVIVSGAATYVVLASYNKEPQTLAKSTQQDSTTNDPMNTDTSSDVSLDKTGPSTIEVVFTDTGFDKPTYFIKAGDTLLIKNESSEFMQFASDDHPSHTKNVELNSPQDVPPIEPGKSIELKPTTPGVFGVHDHIRAQFKAEIEVTE